MKARVDQEFEAGVPNEHFIKPKGSNTSLSLTETTYRSKSSINGGNVFKILSVKYVKVTVKNKKFNYSTEYLLRTLAFLLSYVIQVHKHQGYGWNLTQIPICQNQLTFCTWISNVHSVIARSEPQLGKQSEITPFRQVYGIYVYQDPTKFRHGDPPMQNSNFVNFSDVIGSSNKFPYISNKLNANP